MATRTQTMSVPSMRPSMRTAAMVIVIMGLAVALTWRGCSSSGTGGAAGKFSSQKAADRFKPVPGPSHGKEKGKRAVRSGT